MKGANRMNNALHTHRRGSSKIEDKEYDVFISFAEPDREIAEILSKILAHVGLSSYYAPKVLPKKSPAQWQTKIIDEGIRKSNCFIPIYTQASLSRSWVLFEIGAATALDMNCFFTRVQNVSDAEISIVPDPLNHYTYKLFDQKELQDLLRNVAEHALRQASQDVNEKISDMFAAQHYLLDSLISMAATRWVFIAGNFPTKRATLSGNRKVQMRKFVKQLSQELLRAGFSITACPQVNPVGKVALHAAEEFVASQSKHGAFGTVCVDYEIAGLYPIDRILRKKPLDSTTANSKWQEHLMKFRKSYLKKQEWLILLGGTDGTKEELQAAMALNKERRHEIKVYPIPCFGGFSAKTFRDLVKSDGHHLQACISCSNQRKPCTRIPQIVANMKKI
jgi:hypothetical protein